MSSLREQYAIEVKRIDSIIYQRLKEALQIDPTEEDVKLDGKNMERLRSRIENRRATIFTLFERDFIETEIALRGQMDGRRIGERVDKYSELANRMLKKRVDEVMDEMITRDNVNAIEFSIGVDRKTFIDAILDGNIEINLDKEQDHDDRS